ncbi:hypothetical protein [Amphiplicatus metriothermophilus]|uniref:Uncharacterized protein n=1 Tax=Amphiplicatus metriothermophilus TaxID=1519374 RepID=A0A239PTN0_9PROT|nr:hypothetical protein [Amphiplicatus metriothermophilus]MBB5519213.1 hypothetical protein [Amphiplicatus metriothermophilus]SNT73282.1 hypothetical protein SAMN06297382_1680 [Amphiplicatus metriothermophilus]
MGSEEFAALIGLSSWTPGQILFAQAVLLVGTALLFSASLFAGAGAVRQAKHARAAVEADLRAVQELAEEARHLTAQMESTAARYAAEAAEHAERARAAASPESGDSEAGPHEETAGPFAAEEDQHVRAAGEDEPDGGRALEAAKQAATTPSALLGGLLRRKR